MANAGKEGENYLDTLLNTVAPDWEETSESPVQPDKEASPAPEPVKSIAPELDQEDSAGDKTLEDAIAILNDLPDMDDTLELSGNPEEDMDELFGLLADLGVDPDEPEPEESGEAIPESVLPDLDSVEKEPEMPEDSMAGPEMPEDSMAEPEMPEDSMAGPEMPEDSMAEPEMPEDIMAEPEMPEDIMADVPGGEEEPQEDDIPFSIDSFMEEEPEAVQDSVDADVSEQPKDDLSVSEDSVAVDDIFQDALAAVGYSENEEEAEAEAEDDVFAMDDIGSLMDQEEEGVSSVPAAAPVVRKKKEKKGPGFFQRIFGNVITDTTADEEEKERQKEEELRQKKAEQKAEKKQQAQVTKEEKAQAAQEKKEQKKQLKAEQAAKKAEEKKRKKEERRAKAAQEPEVVGKINPVGATIVFILFLTIGIITVLGTNMLGRRSNLGNAENYFANEDYIRAYDAINSVKLKEKDEVLFRRIRICCQLQKEIRSFKNYNTMGMKVEALDSLLKGIKFYEENISEAQELQIQPAYEKLKNQVMADLSENFGMGEKEVGELLAIPDQAQYTQRLQQITGA